MIDPKYLREVAALWAEASVKGRRRGVGCNLRTHGISPKIPYPTKLLIRFGSILMQDLIQDGSDIRKTFRLITPLSHFPLCVDERLITGDIYQIVLVRCQA